MGDFMKIKIIDAAHRGDVEDLEFCLKLGGVDVNSVNEGGMTALLAATIQGNEECVKKLLTSKDLDVNKPGNDGKTALFIACQKGFRPIVQALLKHPNINVNTPDRYTTSPLMVALRARLDDILTLLLKHPGIDINFQKKDGTTALMYATTLGHIKVVRELLSRRDINLALTNKSGQTAESIAKKKGSTAIINLFNDLSKRKESKNKIMQSNRNFRKYADTLKRNSSISEGLSDNSEESDGVNAENSLSEDQKVARKSENKKKALTQMIRLKSWDDSKSLIKSAGGTEHVKRKLDQEKEENDPATVTTLPVDQTLTEKQERLTQLFKDVAANNEVVGESQTDKEIEGKSDKESAKGVEDEANGHHDVFFITTSRKDLPEFSQLKSKSLLEYDIQGVQALGDVLANIEKSNAALCLIDENLFNKAASAESELEFGSVFYAIAATAFSFVNKVPLFGMYPSSLGNSDVFKNVFRQGGAILTNNEWEALERYDVKYPNVYDAVEHLSKNLVTNIDELKGKLKM